MSWKNLEGSKTPIEHPEHDSEKTSAEDTWWYADVLERREAGPSFEDMVEARRSSALTGAAILKMLAQPRHDQTAHKETALSPKLAQMVERTTGQRPGQIPIVQGRGSEARAENGAIVLGPDVPNAEHPQGQKIRLHEAIHLLQQRLPSPDPARSPSHHRASVELEAAQITEAALADGRQPIRQSADPAAAYAFTELAEAQSAHWNASVETARTPLQGIGDAETPDAPKGSAPEKATAEPSARDEEALEPEAPEVEGTQADTSEDARSMEAASEKADSTLDKAEQERPVTTPKHKGSGPAGGGQDESGAGDLGAAKAGGAAQTEVDQAQKEIAGAVERGYGGDTPETGLGDAPSVTLDTSSADAALRRYAQHAQETLARMNEEAQAEHGEEGLAATPAPFADFDPELDVEIPEFDPEALLDQERAARVMGPDTAGLSLDALVLVRDEERQAYLDSNVANAPETHRNALETRKADGERELSDRRLDARDEDQRQIEAARAGVETERQAWLKAQRAMVDDKRAGAEAFVQGKVSEAEGRKKEADAQVVSIFADAETEAKRLEQDAHTRAESKEREGQNEEKSWLEAGADWVRDKANAVVESISAIFEAARKAIAALLERAQELAHRVIDAAVAFIDACLTAICDHLDALIDALPEQLQAVADRHLKTIRTVLDEAQAALDGWAEDLKDAVDSAVETLTDALGELLTALEEAITEAMEALNALLDTDVMAWLAAEFPILAQLLGEGFDGVMAQIGEAASGALQPIFERLGLSDLTETFQGAVDVAGSGDLMGALTGCCECFVNVLSGLTRNFEQMLAGDGFQDFKRSIEADNTEDDRQTLEMVKDVFALIKAWGEPVYDFIVEVGQMIDAAMAALGILGDVLWQQLAQALGLDPSLPPLEAIQKKIEALWDEAVAELQPLIDAVTELWRWLKEDSILAPVFDLIAKVPEAIDALRQLWDVVLREGKRWVAEIEEAIVEHVAAAMDTISGLADAALNTLKGFAMGLLERLGVLEAWRTAVDFFAPIVEAIQGVVAQVRAALNDVLGRLEEAWKALTEAMAWLGEQARKAAEFMVGFSMAVAALTALNPLPMIAFIAGNAWLLLPECYKEALIDFVVDLFVTFVEAAPMPAEFDIFGNMVRSAALAFLGTLKSMGMDDKIKAMDVLARLMAGQAAAEFIAGLTVGLLKGVWDSTVGTLVFFGKALAWLGGLFIPGSGGADQAAEHEQAREEPEAQQDQEQTQDDAASPTQDSPAHDQGPDRASEGASGESTAPPTAPGDLLEWRVLLEKVFKEGMTLEDVDHLLKAFGSNLEALASGYGERGAEALVSTLKNASGAMYAVGEKIGFVGGVIVTEIVIAILAGMAAPASGGGTLAALIAKWGTLAAKHLPKLVRALKAAATFFKPILTVFMKLKGQIAAWAARVLKYIDNLVLWAKRQLRKLRPGRKPKPKKKPKGKDKDGGALKTKAKQAARAALDQAKAKTKTKIASKSEIEAIAKQVAKAHSKGPVTLKIDVNAKTAAKVWDFKATASKKGEAPKSHTATGGWVALSKDKKTPWFAAADQTQIHKKVVANADARLEKEAQAIAKKTPGLKEIHKALKPKIKAVEKAPQPKLLQGVEFNIEEEGFKKGKDARGKDALIYRWTIAPNTGDDELTVSVDEGDIDNVDMPTQDQIDLYFANYLAIQQPPLASLIKYADFKSKASQGNAYDIKSGSWLKLQDTYVRYINALGASDQRLTGKEFTNAIYCGRRVDTSGRLEPVAGWQARAQWPAKYVGLLYGVPTLARIPCAAARQSDLALALEKHHSHFDPVVGRNSDNLDDLIIYMRGGLDNTDARAKNLVDFNAIAPVKLTALLPSLRTSHDTDYVKQYTELTTDQRDLLDAYASNEARIEHYRQMLMKDIKFSGSALKSGMIVIGMIHDKNALIKTNRVRDLANAHQNHGPGKGTFGTLQWGNGQEANAPANITKHFEKHVCNQHGNPDSSEPYKWMQSIRFDIEKTWLDGLVSAGQATLTPSDEAQIFGGDAQITNSTQAQYFFTTYITANPNLVGELRNLYEARYASTVINAASSASPSYICFGDSAYFAAFNGNIFITGRLQGGLSISSGYFPNPPGSKLATVQSHALWQL